jgi:hypothetical protein
MRTPVSVVLVMYRFRCVSKTRTFHYIELYVVVEESM